MGVYERLGVRRVINADATLTRLGGSLMPREVLDAMREAAGSFVDMYELQQVVGKRLAELTRNEAAYVSTGAAAGIVLATLAAMNRGDLETIARADRDGGGAGERGDRPARASHPVRPGDPAGRRAHRRRRQSPADVPVGAGGGDHAAHGDDLLRGRRSIWRRGALPLEETVEIAHAHGVPVVVDAAAQLPPTENLWRFTRELGADLAVFSGGKDFHGPQASGLLVGTEAMIAAVAVNGSPYQRLARPMKVGKEEMIGLLDGGGAVCRRWTGGSGRGDTRNRRAVGRASSASCRGLTAQPRLSERGRPADAALPRGVRAGDWG